MVCMRGKSKKTNKHFQSSLNTKDNISILRTCDRNAKRYRETIIVVMNAAVYSIGAVLWGYHIESGKYFVLMGFSLPETGTFATYSC